MVREREDSVLPRNLMLARWTKQSVAAAQHHDGIGIGILDRLVEDTQLGDVFFLGSRPEHRIVRLSVVLEISNTALGPRDDIVNESIVVIGVPGRGRGERPGRFLSGPW